MVLLGLSVLFKEKTNKILSFGSEVGADMEPIYMSVSKKILTMDDDMFSLVLEGDVLLKTGSFLSVFNLMMAAVYTLNLAYPKSLEKTLLFIQTIVLGLKDTSEQILNKKLLSVLTELKRDK